MKRTVLLAVALTFAGGVLSAAPAEAKQYRYAGIHPIAEGVFCYIQFPHIHVVAPSKPEVLYREHDDASFFVGDPVAYGYDGPKHAYYGHHPIAVDFILDEHELDGDEVEYCYLDGPHYHSYLPAANTRFVTKGGVYYFAGDFPNVYVEAKPRLARINVVYRPMKYSRPVVVAAPPLEYTGPVVEVVAIAPGVVVAEPVEVVEPVVVDGPAIRGGVEVTVPIPTLEVYVPGVVVEERGRVHYYDHHDHDRYKYKKYKTHKKHKRDKKDERRW